jgi:hemoglobin
MKRISIVLAGLLAAISINFAQAADQILYDQLGGKPGVTKIIDDFVGNVLGDNRIKGFFANANIPRLKMLLVEQVCAEAGGGCTYTGKNMVDSHKGMKIKSADFNALVEDMQKSLQSNNLPIGAQNRLLAILAPMKRDVDNK